MACVPSLGGCKMFYDCCLVAVSSEKFHSALNYIAFLVSVGLHCAQGSCCIPTIIRLILTHCVNQEQCCLRTISPAPQRLSSRLASIRWALTESIPTKLLYVFLLKIFSLQLKSQALNDEARSLSVEILPGKKGALPSPTFFNKTCHDFLCQDIS